MRTSAAERAALDAWGWAKGYEGCESGMNGTGIISRREMNSSSDSRDGE